MSNITLLQLISEQTIQNLLPILRLKPGRLVHLVTHKTADKSAGLQSAARAAGLTPETEVIRMSGMPGIPESFRAVADQIESEVKSGGEIVVNFTGGTKLMSIGAYAAARNAKVPSLYVDTQDACFVDGATSEGMARLLDQDFSFTPLRSQLRVDVLGIANGVERITGGKPTDPVLPLARRLFEEPEEELGTHEALHGDRGFFPRGREPRTPADWLAALDRNIRLPTSIARLAVEAGLMRPGSFPEAVRLPDATRSDLEQLVRQGGIGGRYFAAVAPLQHAASFLTGGWWEVIVLDAAGQCGLFRDLRWSVHVGSRTGPDTEEDILGLDGAELLYINCKRGGARARLLPLLEEIKSRAATIGGAFNRRFLAVCLPPQGRIAANLETQANRLGIRLLHRDNVYHPGAFSR